jgi:hypothetical protein
MSDSNFTISDKDYKILKQKIEKIKSKNDSDESDWDDFWFGETIGVVK